MPETMTQVAPYPDELADLVDKLSYRPGWRFRLREVVRDPVDTHGAEGKGLTFIVFTGGYDTYHPDRGEGYRVAHYFIVPAATYDRESWQRWLLDRLIEVETHEACEFFVIDGERPFAPHHGPGQNPYTITQYGTDEQRRTSFRGVEVMSGRSTPSLLPTERAVLEAFKVRDEEDSDGAFAPYHHAIAAAAGNDADQAYAACKRLKKAGLLTTSPGARQGAHLRSAPSYWITDKGKQVLAD